MTVFNPFPSLSSTYFIHTYLLHFCLLENNFALQCWSAKTYLNSCYIPSIWYNSFHDVRVQSLQVNSSRGSVPFPSYLAKVKLLALNDNFLFPNKHGTKEKPLKCDKLHTGTNVWTQKHQFIYYHSSVCNTSPSWSVFTI